MLDSEIFKSGDVTGPGPSTPGGIVTYYDNTGKQLSNSGKTLPGGMLVGMTDDQTLSNKAINFKPTAAAWTIAGNCVITSTSGSDNGAFATFLRNGSYGINLGLDTSNTFKLSGYTAGATTLWSVNTTGVMSIYRSAFFGVGEYNAGNSGSSISLSFSNGQKQRLTLTANATVSMTFPGVGNYLLRVIQDATGNRTLTMGGNVRYMGSATLPEINSAANGETIYSIYWSGNYAYIGGQKVGV